MGKETKKIAIVLFNLGGPDSPAAVEPFLFNLFNDPAIIRVPGFLRRFIAKRISRKRAPIAQKIYAQLGGGSPILPNTQVQAQALEAALVEYGAPKVFISMRYWHPMSAATVKAIAAYAPDQLIFLPLYPQFSTTTTASSLKDFRDAVQADNGDLHARWNQELKITTIGCYPTDSGFIRAMSLAIRAAYPAALKYGQPRILFSAHGLPEKIIRSGDPYQWQCEQTAQALVRDLGIPKLDWVNCYQSRVGPLKWITPSTEDEIRRAGTDGVPIILVPIAFVSEHSETLVELDIEYRHLAEESGVPSYSRIPTVGTSPEFITGLARLVRQALTQETGATACGQGNRICPPNFTTCICQQKSSVIPA
jgi:ferrochelatase